MDEKYLIDEAAKAERAGKASLVNFEAKHLNVQVGMALRSDDWVGAEHWDRGVEPGLTFEAILDRSEVICVGNDGGGLDDLFGIAIIGREKKTRRWLAWAHALISPHGLERRKINRSVYDQFIADGDLTVVDLPDDLAFIVDLVKRIKDRQLLAKVGVDAVGIGGLVDALAEIGVTQDDERLGAVRQGIAHMAAYKTIERKLVDGSFRHDGSRLMKWCVGNVRIVPTRTASMVARDEAGAGKIDPFVALLNAAALMSLNPTPVRDTVRELHEAILARGGFA